MTCHIIPARHVSFMSLCLSAHIFMSYSCLCSYLFEGCFLQVSVSQLVVNLLMAVILGYLALMELKVPSFRLDRFFPRHTHTLRIPLRRLPNPKPLYGPPIHPKLAADMEQTEGMDMAAKTASPVWHRHKWNGRERSTFSTSSF